MDFIVTFFTGLGLLLLQMGVTLALGAAGVFAYMKITPYSEIDEINAGNIAAGVSFGGILIGLAFPLGATLGSSAFTVDVIIWGLVAVLIQLLALLVTTKLNKSITVGIKAGSIAAALKLASIQVAVGIVNAGAMSG